VFFVVYNANKVGSLLIQPHLRQTTPSEQNKICDYLAGI